MEKNLIDIIAKSGIVGAGGAGFPAGGPAVTR